MCCNVYTTVVVVVLACPLAQSGTNPARPERPAAASIIVGEVGVPTHTHTISYKTPYYWPKKAVCEAEGRSLTLPEGIQRAKVSLFCYKINVNFVNLPICRRTGRDIEVHADTLFVVV